MNIPLEGFLHSCFTCTGETIAFKTRCACTYEAPICVTAVGIGTTRWHLEFTLVDICKSYKSRKDGWN